MIVKIPGINGLGKTNGVEKAPDLITDSPNEIKVDNANVKDQQKTIYENALKYFNDRVVFIGGDHSISYSTCRAFLEKYKNPCLIVFDAHADCMDPMEEPTHEEWLRALGFSDVLMIGVEKIEKEENDYIKQKGIKLTKDLEEIKEFIKGKNVYVSIDIDVLDVKSTGYPEGKMSEDEFMKILDVILEGDVKACDLVEYNPDKEDGKTLALCKRILKKITL